MRAYSGQVGPLGLESQPIVTFGRLWKVNCRIMQQCTDGQRIPVQPVLIDQTQCCERHTRNWSRQSHSSGLMVSFSLLPTTRPIRALSKPDSGWQ